MSDIKFEFGYFCGLYDWQVGGHNLLPKCEFMNPTECTKQSAGAYVQPRNTEEQAAGDHQGTKKKTREIVSARMKIYSP